MTYLSTDGLSCSSLRQLLAICDHWVRLPLSFISRPLALHGQSPANRYGMVSLLINLCIAADCVKQGQRYLAECFGHNYRCSRIVHLFDKSHSGETQPE